MIAPRRLHPVPAQPVDPKVAALHQALEETRQLLIAHVDRNIRELQTALGRIVADREPLESQLAEVALRELVGDGPEPPIHVGAVIEACAGFYGFTVDELLGRRTFKQLAHARQVAMYLCRELIGLSLLRVGEVFGRDHTTVMHAERKIRAGIGGDSGVSGQVQDITVLTKRRAALDALRSGGVIVRSVDSYLR